MRGALRREAAGLDAVPMKTASSMRAVAAMKTASSMRAVAAMVATVAALIASFATAAIALPACAYAGDVTATIKCMSRWETGGSRYANYDITIANGTDQTIASWSIAVDTGGVPFTISQSWNCTSSLSADGRTITFAPAQDWGKKIAPGGTQNFGLIVSSAADTQWSSYKVSYTTEQGSAGDASGTGGSSGDAGSGSSGSSSSGGTGITVPVARGIKPLHVSGTQLCDSSGNPVRLQGVSLHGLGFGTDFTRYVNRAAFQTLRDDGGANVVRLPVYTQEYGGWCSGGDRDTLRRVVNDGVTYATNLGMYVIIDWHILSDGDPWTHQADAVAFFREMSARYAALPNVIYEICNEPNGGTDWRRIKSYAETVIPVIRANDPDAVIICGTPTWSQDVDQVASAPLPYGNVMYACHFYAATHGDYLRQKVKRAIAAGTPVFISESSICDASGNGAVDYASAEAWKALIRDYGLSYIEWSLCNKNEAASAISPSCGKVSGWSPSELSATGRWYRDTMRALSGTTGSAPGAGSAPMYRCYNPNSGEHFYTASAGERDQIVSVGWRYEGIGWYAPTSGKPVYRLYNPNAGDHHYTVSVSERESLVSLGWRYEGVGWQSGGSTPLYREYNPNAVAGAHNYTSSEGENDWLVSLGWRYEGIAWYGV